MGLMLSVPLAAQKTYYMDPEGSDSNPGTSDKPFATLVKVQEVVVAGDVVISIREHMWFPPIKCR